MYLDASSCCNILKFALGSGTSSVQRQWNIKVTQYSCDYNNLAPDGCTQYFYGNGGSGTLMTYNFAGGVHLANQKDRFCIRSVEGS